MNEQDDNLVSEQFADVLADLKGIRADIARRKYPGVAWQAPRRRLHYILWPAAAAAAAAALIAAIVLLSQPGPNKPSNLVQRPVPSAPTPGEDEADLLVLEQFTKARDVADWPSYQPQESDEYEWPFVQQDQGGSPTSARSSG